MVLIVTNTSRAFANDHYLKSNMTRINETEERLDDVATTLENLSVSSGGSQLMVLEGESTAAHNINWACGASAPIKDRFGIPIPYSATLVRSSGISFGTHETLHHMSVEIVNYGPYVFGQSNSSILLKTLQFKKEGDHMYCYETTPVNLPHSKSVKGNIMSIGNVIGYNSSNVVIDIPPSLRFRITFEIQNVDTGEEYVEPVPLNRVTLSNILNTGPGSRSLIINSQNVVGIKVLELACNPDDLMYLDVNGEMMNIVSYETVNDPNGLGYFYYFTLSTNLVTVYNEYYVTTITVDTYVLPVNNTLIISNLNHNGNPNMMFESLGVINVKTSEITTNDLNLLTHVNIGGEIIPITGWSNSFVSFGPVYRFTLNTDLLTNYDLGSYGYVSQITVGTH